MNVQDLESIGEAHRQSNSAVCKIYQMEDGISKSKETDQSKVKVDDSSDHNVKVTHKDTHVDKGSHHKLNFTDIGRSRRIHSDNITDRKVKVMDTDTPHENQINSSIIPEVKLKDTQSACESDVMSSTSEQDEVELVEFLKEKFRTVAGEDQLIDRQEFLHIFGLQNNFFAGRFFELLDQDKEGSIDLGEFLQGMKLLMRGSPEKKLQFLFDVYDVDGSGEIDQEELSLVMQHCIQESQMKLEPGALNSLTNALFDMADTDMSGSISFEELYAVLKQYPGVMDNLTFSAAQWLSMSKGRQSNRRNLKIPRYFTRTYFINNKQHCFCVLVYTLLNIALFATCVRYREHNPAVILARGCGMCLNFNCALVLLLMLRHSLTWLRSTPFRYLLPIDDHVTYHRNVGYFIVIQSLLHTIAHLINIALVVDISNDNTSANSTVQPVLTFSEVLFTMKSKVGFVGPGFAYISGVVLLVVLMVMFICALPCVRRHGYFQLFHFTHLLHLAVWIFLLLHGPIFWIFVLLPGIIFILEKVIPRIHRAGTGTKFFIKDVHLLPSEVTHLVVNHPGKFSFHPGDYVFIKIPVIAKFETHPFTISSAPEQKDAFWLHVRSVGFWTRRLNQYFKEYPHPPQAGRKKHGKRRLPQKSTKNQGHRKTCKDINYRVYIEGPYGTPSRDIFNREHAVLIASGIGVTPFASILQSIMYRHLHKSHTEGTQLSNPEYTDMQLKKVDFIWINRDNISFGWFANILQELEDQQSDVDPNERFLEMQLYMTSALSMHDMKGFALQVAIDAMQKKGERSLVTGLRSQFKPGRPNWKQVFADIIKGKRGDLKVFFCGNPALGKVLKDTCDELHLEFAQEIF